MAALAQGDFAGSTHMMPFDEDTISYSKAKDIGPVAKLQERIEKGEVHLAYDRSYGFLPGLLRELGISTNSQMLVFSKTSFQRERISPQSPRALYFNDDAYVGFIPGAPLIEVSVAEPKLGGVFYTLEQKPVEKPRFVRTDQCLECHASSKSMGVPGHLVRSFVTDESGVVDLATGISPVTDRTPLADRWGGWYVSGTHGSQTHRGNLIGKAAFERHEKEPNFEGNVTDLSPFFDTSHYLSPHSDIVALMVLEHQTHMHNFITRLNYGATLALQQYGHIRYLNSVVEAFLKTVLFTEEVQLTAPVRGTSQFMTWFPKQGPRDKQGRSLRDFDLKTRLFRFPCSYLIYSDAFEALPEPMKAHIYERLRQILSGDDKKPEFAKMTPEDKRAVLEILEQTKPGFAQTVKTASGK